MYKRQEPNTHEDQTKLTNPEELKTSDGWMRATSSSGDPDFQNTIGWTGSLGVGKKEPEKGQPWKVDSTNKSQQFLMSKIGWKLNLNTLVSMQSNWLAALLVMGALLSIADPLTLSDNELILMGFTLAPALSLGLVGDPVFKILQEQKAVDWWRAQQNSVPNSYVESLLSGFLITALSMQIFIQSIDYRIILVGGLIALSTSFAVRFLQMSTIRLARSNAVFIRLLTPILILPWGIVVDYCANL